MKVLESGEIASSTWRLIVSLFGLELWKCERSDLGEFGKWRFELNRKSPIHRVDGMLRVDTPEQLTIQQLNYELEWLWANCKVVYFPPDSSYPMEHAPLAGKNARSLIELIARDPKYRGALK